MSPHRDPETGQFLPHSTAQYDDIEMVTFASSVGVEASNLGGGTGFSGGESNNVEGVQLIDYDDIVDRNESLDLIYAEHRLTAFPNSTETADGTVAVNVECSASPSASTPVLEVFPRTDSIAPSSSDAVGRARDDDSIDIVGRIMSVVGHAPFSDGSSGVGGGGSAGEDVVEIDGGLPSEAGRFHPRDELFLNGRLVTWNIDDGGVHANLSGQHVYGVVSD